MMGGVRERGRSGREREEWEVAENTVRNCLEYSSPTESNHKAPLLHYKTQGGVYC